MNLKAYVLAVGLAALAGFAANTRLNSIAACTGEGYGDDRYLAYCGADGYGDFEHGALYLSLVPEAVQSLRRADVLILGNSRTQRAFSTRATGDFFAALGARFYAMGFGYGENVNFAQALFERHGLRPRAVIVNADPFFDTDLSWPARTLLRTENGPTIYGGKLRWQELHRAVCGDATTAWLCGDEQAIFRSATDGRWTLSTGRPSRDLPIRPVAETRWLEQGDVLAERARSFLAGLGVPRSCVVFTVVPSDFATYQTARHVAEAAGVPLVVAEEPDLLTTDRSHLTQASAERWSGSFLRAIEGRLRSCLSTDSTAVAERVR